MLDHRSEHKHKRKHRNHDASQTRRGFRNHPSTDKPSHHDDDHSNQPKHHDSQSKKGVSMKYKITSALGVAILSMFVLVTVTAAGNDAEISKGARTFDRVRGVYEDRGGSAKRRVFSDDYRQVEVFFDVAKRPSADSKRDFNTRRFVDVDFVDSQRDFNTRRFVDVDFADLKRDFNTRRGNRLASFSFSTNCRADF